MAGRAPHAPSFTRRRLLALAAAAPLAAWAQPARARRIGILVPGPSVGPNNMDVLFEGLRDLGYVEGRNLVVERRFSEGRDERLPGLAAELVRQEVELIVAAGPTATRAAREATGTVPIVMGTYDPVEQGLVASLAQPGGNVTGWSVLSTETAEKQLALLKEAMPRLARAAILVNPTMLAHLTRAGRLATSARSLGLTLKPVELSGPEALAPAFAAMREDRVEAFLVVAEPKIDRLRGELASAAAQHRLPGIYSWRFYADAGGLMAYGPSLRAMIALWPSYVDKILKGARPGDLPVQTPTKYELVLNQRTARELGFTFPSSLLLAADQVIA